MDEAKLAYIREHASQDTGIQGQWHSDSAGTWYQYTTGEIPTNDWREIEDNWYYFDGSGYMVKNQWVDRYYVGNDGKMLKETTTPDGHYVDENRADGSLASCRSDFCKFSAAYHANFLPWLVIILFNSPSLPQHQPGRPINPCVIAQLCQG